MRTSADLGELLDRLALSQLAERLPAETSIGQQQRVALARAVAQRPRLLLLDEPSSHQDPGSAELVWASIADARDHGSACLVATHDERAAERANRMWSIVDGRVTPS
jgi:putative ABC transport system ATP-binding protein